jgi:3-oxoadipate enol-lactonase
MLPRHEVHGPSKGPALVLIHGFPFDRHQWDGQVQTFSHAPSGKDAPRIVAYDQRGHGETPPGPGPLMIEFLVDDLIELLDHLRIPKATLCGLSMGGYVALRAVDRHPERVHGLVLADTQAGADDNAGRVKRADAIRKIRKGGMEALTEGLLPSLFPESELKAMGPGVARIKAQMLATDPDGACLALGAMACRLDLTERLQAIRTPTLVLVGAEDKITPPERSREMHQRIPGSKLVVIPGAGHVANVSAPKAFNEALRGFLDTLPRLAP